MHLNINKWLYKHIILYTLTTNSIVTVNKAINMYVTIQSRVAIVKQM